MLTSTAPVATPASAAPRELIHPVLFDRLCNRIVDDEGVTREAAELIMEGALLFLQLCARHPGQFFSPSKPVDIGWHTFILYTKAYAGFCERMAGRFIHHEPADNPLATASGMTIHDTITFMDEHAIAYNPVLWKRGSESCISNESELQVAGLHGPVSMECDCKEGRGEAPIARKLDPTCQQYCGGGHGCSSSAKAEVAEILASGCSHSESGCGKCSECSNGNEGGYN